MSYNIDHIVIRVDDLERETEAFSKLFGIEPYVPPIDHVFLSNSVFRIGTTDIELLKCGEKNDFEPYLFGISFGSTQSPWEVIDEMNRLGIRHTLPAKAAIELPSGKSIWCNILLEGLLDDPTPTAYGMAKPSAVTKSIAKLFDWLLSSPALKKSLLKNLGESMVFFTFYESAVNSIREEATRRLVASGGGPLGLATVSHVVIEAGSLLQNWQALTGSGISGDTQVQVIPGSTNSIQSVELEVNKSSNSKELVFGNAVFTLKHVEA